MTTYSKKLIEVCAKVIMQAFVPDNVIKKNSNYMNNCSKNRKIKNFSATRKNSVQASDIYSNKYLHTMWKIIINL